MKVRNGIWDGWRFLPAGKSIGGWVGPLPPLEFLRNLLFSSRNTKMACVGSGVSLATSETNPTRYKSSCRSCCSEPRPLPHATQQTLWPGVLELSQDFFDTLTHHAVPLDYRALAALKHSALALDVYTWMAHRLCRVKKAQGEMLSWQNLRDQFGQEYRNTKNFKKEFRHVLHQVKVVYPDAGIEETPGGLILHESRPPLSKTMVAKPAIASRPVEKS